MISGWLSRGEHQRLEQCGQSNQRFEAALESRLVEKILAEIEEEEIVAMCCDVINIPSPTGEELPHGGVHAVACCGNSD